MTPTCIRYPETALWSLRPAALGEERHPLEFLDSLARRGDVVPFMLGRRRAVLLNRPDFVSAVLVSHAWKFPKGGANRRAKHLLGNGLLTADTERHTARRALIQPAFARARLQECSRIIVRRARETCGLWHRDQVVDITGAIGRLTFGSVGEAIIGADVGPHFQTVTKAVSEATASLDPLISLVAPLRRVRRANTQLRRVVETIARRPPGQGSEGSLLALLDECEPGLASADERIDDLLTILLAGHDTITSALTWTLLLLAAHPEVERQMHDELRAVLAEREPTAADTSSLPYTRAVLAESLRLYPPAWVLARQALESHRFDEDEVPAGTIVLISQYLLHRDERYFPRPGVFDPNRWTMPAGPGHPRFAYFPFGAGTRACIGESFGWLEGVLLLATIGQRWQLRPVDAAFPAIETRVTLRPRGRVLMRVAPLSGP